MSATKKCAKCQGEGVYYGYVSDGPFAFGGGGSSSARVVCDCPKGVARRVKDAKRELAAATKAARKEKH